jgi:zinc protease
VVQRLGGNENAATSSDYTNYFQRSPRDKLATLMEYEADRMTGLTLKDSEVLPERDVVLEEYNMRVANSPDARLSEQVSAALYLNHPYGRPVIGWRQEIEQLNREDALEFYKRFYAPNNAIVVVAGDVTTEEVRALAEKYYGPLVPQPAIPAKRTRPQEPVPISPRTVTFADPRVEQPSMRRVYLVPSVSTAKEGESAALEVLAHILGGGPSGYLYKSLVMDKKIAVGAGSWYWGTALDATQFGVSATPRPGIEFAQIETALDAVIADVIANGVKAEDLERVKTQLVSEAIYAQDNQGTLARWFGGSLMAGQTLDDVISWPQRVRAVTAKDVQDAARQWLDKKRSVTGYLIKDTAPREEKRS